MDRGHENEEKTDHLVCKKQIGISFARFEAKFNKLVRQIQEMLPSTLLQAVEGLRES